MIFKDGAVYEGTVTRGIIDGIGELKQPDGSAYRGSFKNGIKEGHGKFYISPEVGGTYALEGEYKDNQPVLTANEMHFQLVSPVEKVEAVDPKAKAPPKGKGDAKPQDFTEEEETKYENRILYQISTDFEEPQVIAFQLKCVYQGPEIEDPNPPEEDVALKKKPTAGKDPALEVPSVRMIKPDPVLLE